MVMAGISASVILVISILIEIFVYRKERKERIMREKEKTFWLTLFIGESLMGIFIIILLFFGGW
jgi:hypothetical protein